MSGAQTQTTLVSCVYYETVRTVYMQAHTPQICILCNYFRCAYRYALESHFMCFVYIYKTCTVENKLSVLINFNIL